VPPLQQRSDHNSTQKIVKIVANETDTNGLVSLEVIRAPSSPHVHIAIPPNQEIVTYISVGLQVGLLQSRNNLRAFWYGRAALGGGVCNYDEICRTLHAFRLLQGRVATPIGALDQLMSEGLHVSVVGKDQALLYLKTIGLFNA
jgi:hypothetical protein